MMRSVGIFLLAVALSASSCNLTGKTEKVACRVTTSGVRIDCPVVIGDVPAWVRSAVVYADDREIASQLDRALNELVFVHGISGTQDFRIVYSSKPAVKSYPSRVHAQMWLKNEDKTLRAIDTVSSDRNDMYHKLHHHGPAFESDMAAYRICFDDGQTVDAYGKKHAQLELARTMWYPTDEQIAQGSGYDNLRVFGSVGVGALKGWDAERGEMAHIADYRRREARIIAKGPVRTVVEMCVEGWRYCGREIDMTSRYILYAGHSDIQVENTVCGDFKGLVFATGVVRMAHSKIIKDKEVIASLGCDFPESDTLKWERECVGLCIAVNPSQIVSQIDDKTSYLFQLTPDVHGRIDYVVEMAWRGSDWQKNFTDDQCLLGLFDAAHQARREVFVSYIR